MSLEEDIWHTDADVPEDEHGYDEPGYDEPEATPEGESHQGQVRMAYRLAEHYSDKLMHVHGVGWHSYDGKRWSEDERGAAKRAVLATLRKALAESLEDKALRRDVTRCESASGIAGVLDIAAALEPFAATVADLDADPYQLNVANGTVDLRTFKLHPHNPQDRITKITIAAFNSDASVEWEQFLTEILPDTQVRQFMQRLVGLSLLGKVREHVLAILTGTGSNGKGTLCEVLAFALGDYASAAEPELFMHREGAHPTGEMDLRGRRWVVVTETDRGKRLAEATMKRLTGGDRIKARRMRQDFVEFPPSHTAVLVTNHLPKVSGDDPAIWRRIRVVPFDVVIPADRRDGQLGERLQLSADAVLTWALAGWRDYSEHGLAEPDAVIVATDQYQLDSDAVRRFIAECCLINPHMHATTKDLHARWLQWQQFDGAEPITSKAFGLAIDAAGYPAGKPSNGKRLRRGIGLQSDDETDE